MSHKTTELWHRFSDGLRRFPAMAAVYGITTRKVFGLYIAFSLFGSLFFGILYYILC